MPRQTRQQQDSAYQKGYKAGYITAVAHLGMLVSEIVSAGQFHEIAERWEQFRKEQIAREANSAKHS